MGHCVIYRSGCDSFTKALKPINGLISMHLYVAAFTIALTTCRSAMVFDPLKVLVGSSCVEIDKLSFQLQFSVAFAAYLLKVWDIPC